MSWHLTVVGKVFHWRDPREQQHGCATSARRGGLDDAWDKGHNGALVGFVDGGESHALVWILVDLRRGLEGDGVLDVVHLFVYFLFETLRDRIGSFDSRGIITRDRTTFQG
jgi:hypothetical protein